MPLPTEEKSYERTSAKQMVYDKMKDWIIEGRLEAGEKLSLIHIYCGCTEMY